MSPRRCVAVDLGDGVVVSVQTDRKRPPSPADFEKLRAFAKELADSAPRLTDEQAARQDAMRERIRERNARIRGEVVPPIPEGLCGVGGCVFTPHGSELGHSWERP